MAPGNDTTAEQLYGNGVRIGTYLQAATLLLYNFRTAPHDVSRKASGLKLACAASMLAILTSWTLLALRHDFCLVEAFIIIALVTMLYLPALGAISTIHAILYEPAAVLSLFLAAFWNIGAFIWF
ncbi:hypothetical protein BU26DRAFT_517222 [Trematosphaeria pertusa]|uniref:Uncharacterized protein n=1 Tax=Trematosphaeria pertusa TaxID=390896 RepID=A0A6A6IQ86_9PLEO|nr:uncharacterized protein BU26DRAFT_517222 [Trematosphaeria pertusa]KAF2252631.1 hypothetical protein BU26DRAFT_517222 [Trematosphaeria pertusa]